MEYVEMLEKDNKELRFDVARLKAENERYRKALEEIQEIYKNGGTAMRIARKALENSLKS